MRVVANAEAEWTQDGQPQPHYPLHKVARNGKILVSERFFRVHYSIENKALRYGQTKPVLIISPW